MKLESVLIQGLVLKVKLGPNLSLVLVSVLKQM